MWDRFLNILLTRLMSLLSCEKDLDPGGEEPGFGDRSGSCTGTLPVLPAENTLCLRAALDKCTYVL